MWGNMIENAIAVFFKAQASFLAAMCKRGAFFVCS